MPSVVSSGCVVRSCSVTMWWSKSYCVLQSTTLYYKVLFQYYISTSLCCKVLVCTPLYYSVLQGTMAYYSSSTLTYKVLLQYYSVLQSNAHDWSSSHMKHMKGHLQCAEQQASPSNLTKDCACHAKWLSWSILLTYERSFTMRGATVSPSNVTKCCACDEKWFSWLTLLTYETSFTISGATGVTLQAHQRLCLPQKMTLMIDPSHIWNVIYNKRSNRCHPSTSSNAAPATKHDSHDWFCPHMNVIYDAWSSRCHPPGSSNTAPATQDDFHDWSSHIWNVFYNAPSNKSHLPTSPNSPPATRKAPFMIDPSHMTHEASFTMRGATKVTLQPHQILPRMPHKMAFQNWRETCPKQMKRHLHCGADLSMIGASHPPVRRGYLSRLGDAFCIEKYKMSRSG